MPVDFFSPIAGALLPVTLPVVEMAVHRRAYFVGTALQIAVLVIYLAFNGVTVVKLIYNVDPALQLAIAAIARLPHFVCGVWLAVEVSRARSDRAMSNFCPVCGYDLRHSPDRCPECGTPRSLPPMPPTSETFHSSAR